MTDLTYTTDGFYISVFAETETGRAAFNDICKYFPNGKLPAHMLSSLKSQLRIAGISFRKSKPKKSKVSDEQLLRELGA